VRLTPQQHQVLLAIRGAKSPENVTIGYLAERLQLKHHSVVGLIDRLSMRKLVKRTADSNDRRIVHVMLTKSGNALIAYLSEAHRDELRSLGPELRVRLTAILDSR
jgi:DNA-binding MarR family transcriptional regulator